MLSYRHHVTDKVLSWRPKHTTMDTNKIREALSNLIGAMERYEMDVDEDAPYAHRSMMSNAREALAELDKAPKVLTDEQAHYLFMGWLHVNHADINDNADTSDLCRRAFLDALRYARANGYLAPAAGLTVEEAVKAVRDCYAAMGWTQYHDEEELRARLTAAIEAKR